MVQLRFRLFALLLAALVLTPLPLAAQGVDAARQAYKSGDYARALVLARPLAEAGDPVAQNLMGAMLELGRGVAPDPGAALAWYERAAAQNLPRALANLGAFWQKGYPGYPPDHEKARAYYARAADLGFARAMNNLGSMLANGQGGPADPEKAAELYRKAAELGHVGAMRNLALAYATGNGVDRDYSRAWELYRKAAAGGDADALNDLGVMHENGYGTPVDPIAAYALYRLAAQRGAPRAGVNLAWFLIREDTAFRDPARAYAWCLWAIENQRARDGEDFRDDCDRLAGLINENARKAAADLVQALPD